MGIFAKEPKAYEIKQGVIRIEGGRKFQPVYKRGVAEVLVADRDGKTYLRFYGEEDAKNKGDGVWDIENHWVSPQLTDFCVVCDGFIAEKDLRCTECDRDYSR